MKVISLLRGINVSGQKKIKMEDLRQLYVELGFRNVVSYIQSGNVIFDTSVKSKAKMISMIEKTIEEHCQFYVPTEIRMTGEFASIIEGCPFVPIDLEKDGTKILVTFLSSTPSQSKVADLLQYVKLPEKLVVTGKQVYLSCPGGYGKSKLTNNFIEQKLGVKATTRNWKSVVKLYDLSAN